MKPLIVGIKYVLLSVLCAAALFLLYTQAKPFIQKQIPCTEPIVYSIGTIDPRYDVSKTELEHDIALATDVWNTVLGKPAFVEGEGGVVVNLIYTSHQATAELGQTISADQQAYNEKKAQVEAMKSSFNAAKAAVEKAQATYNTSAQAYQAEVEVWNKKGGAPALEYSRLQAQKAALDAERVKVNTAIATTNTLADQLNTYVDELNTLAQKINAKADAYNSTAGTDFEQGEYKEESGAKSISIFEFTTTATLERVLTHEFGHALGLEHVQNPDSIMYAYNIGRGLMPTEEDTAELKRVCNVK